MTNTTLYFCVMIVCLLLTSAEICDLAASTKQWSSYCHRIGTFSTLLALCAGNSSVTGEFPAQRPVTRSFDAFFDLRWVNNKYSVDLRLYRSHYDATVMMNMARVLSRITSHICEPKCLPKPWANIAVKSATWCEQHCLWINSIDRQHYKMALIKYNCNLRKVYVHSHWPK